MKKERIKIIDYLKAICIIFVIILHCDKPFELGISNSMPYVFFFKMAVPIFMILSGYTAAMAQGQTGHLREQYKLKNVWKKFMRFTIPIIVCVVFYLLLQSVKGVELSLSKVWNIILLAKFGSGAYYYHLMIQFIFLSPIIVACVRRYLEKGVIALIITNLIYEIGIHALGVDESIYRVLICRYLTEIALGSYMFFRKDKIKNTTLGMSIILGGGYIFALKYLGYVENLFTYWTDTNMLVSFWIFPIIYLVIYYGKTLNIKGIVGNMVSLFGKASYHIFCVQMMWFAVGKFISDSILYMFSPWMKTMIAVVVCLICGSCFYFVEQQIWKICKRHNNVA